MILNKTKIVSLFALTCCSLVTFAQDVNKTDANGKRDGKWVGYYENTNRVRYEGVFKNGVEQGVFNFYEDSPKSNIVAKRDFSLGNGNALTTFFDSKGKKVSEGNFKNKEKDGKWLYFQADGLTIMSEENYVNGLLDGQRKVFYKSGQLSDDMTYKNGKLQGKVFQYAENGQVIKEEFYVDDVKNGKATYRDASGKITQEGEFEMGKKIGAWAKP